MSCFCVKEINMVCMWCEKKEKFNNLPIQDKIKVLEIWEVAVKDLTVKENAEQYKVLFDYCNARNIEFFDFNFDLFEGF